MSSLQGGGRGLEMEISNLLGLVGGSGGTSSSSTGGGDGVVTVSMLEHVGIQLKEKFTNEIIQLRREFGVEQKERKENEKRLTTCIEKLMGEVLQLHNQMRSLMSRVEELEKRCKVPAVARTASSSNPAVRLGSKTDAPEGTSRGNNTNMARRSSMNVAFLKFRDSPRNKAVSPLENPSSKSLRTSPRLRDPVSSSKRGDAPGTSMMIPKLKDETGGNEPPEIDCVIHKISSKSGSNLPLMCVCKMEFDSLPKLYQHVREQNMETSDDPMNGRSTSTTGQGPTASTSGNPQTRQLGSIKAVRPPKLVDSRKVAPLPKLIDVRKVASPPKLSSGKGAQHAKDPSRPLFCLCGRKYAGETNLMDHIRYFREKIGRLPCNFCGKRFSVQSQLTRHLKQAHKKGAISLGRRRVAPMTSTKMTRRQNGSDKKTIPGLGMEMDPDLDAGVVTKKKFQCNLCPCRFSFRVQLKHHKETKHKTGFKQNRNVKADEGKTTVASKLDTSSSSSTTAKKDGRPARKVIPSSRYKDSALNLKFQAGIKKSDGGYKFCLCKTEIPGINMVRCENSQCKFGTWFHYDNDPPCVQYNNQKTWYCTQCVQNGDSLKK